MNELPPRPLFLQQTSLLEWENTGDGDDARLQSDSDDEGETDISAKQRKKAEDEAEAAEKEARETAEEKRLRLARDVLLKLDAEQREHVCRDS